MAREDNAWATLCILKAQALSWNPETNVKAVENMIK